MNFCIIPDEIDTKKKKNKRRSMVKHIEVQFQKDEPSILIKKNTTIKLFIDKYTFYFYAKIR